MIKTNRQFKSSLCRQNKHGISCPGKKQGAIPAFYDLYVDIPDIAGAVAKVTNVLSQANLSIINLSIQETREDIFGVLELSFKNQADLLKGQKLIEAEKFHCWIRS